MKKLCCTLIWLTCTMTLLNAAVSTGTIRFSIEKSKFISELDDFINAKKNNKLSSTFKIFRKHFTNDAFSDEEFEQIHLLCNQMVERKLKASPHFGAYLSCLNQFKEHELSQEQLINWHLMLAQMLASKTKARTFAKLLKFSTTFIEGQFLKYSKSGFSWFVESKAFDFKIHEEKPCVTVAVTNLVCVRKKKFEIRINETSGLFFPLSGLWQGEGGKVSWAKAGLETVYASLDKYSFKPEKALYQIKNAKLHYPAIFPTGPIAGSLQDKIVIGNKSKESSYPRFQSADSTLHIKTFREGVSYRGGFRMQGKTIYGFGSELAKAEIEIREQGKLMFKGAAQEMTMKGTDLIVGKQMEATLYFGIDSLYHPSVNLKFNLETKELNLARGKRGSDRNPFYNSYHQIYIDSDKLDWFLENDSMVINQKRFSAGNESQNVTFESFNYFDVRDFRRLQNVASTNPIATLKLIAEEEKTRIFEADKLAKKLNPAFDIQNIQSLLYELLAEGYINYYKDRQLVEVKNKVFHYADANVGKTDYDVIKFVSNSNRTNAHFNLKAKDILINDVAALEFSHGRHVAAKPSDQKITLQKNRNMVFGGSLFAGNTRFEGKQFQFNYDQFSLDLDSVRYFDLFIPGETAAINGKAQTVSIGSRLEHTNGNILIDAPSNKSGKEKIAMFPAFNSSGPCFVFYDREDILDGCYKRDSFFFMLDEFHLNNLDNLEKKDLRFKGKLYSAGIFPTLKETLLVQEEDKSLGFVHQSPERGYPIYFGKGRYHGAISLSNSGLLGKGNLTYLWASLEGKEITFKPKQCLTSAQKFELSEDRSSNIQVPKIIGQEVSVDWRPMKDSMYLHSSAGPFELFQKPGYTIEETLILTPDGVKARGVFNWEIGNVYSDLFSLGAFSAEADTSDVKIKVSGLDHLALHTTNVYSKMDFDNMIGTVRANSDTITTILPYNRYKTSMNEFDWNMREELITFKAVEGRSGQFLSLDETQDSLSFEGKTALYNLRTNALLIGGVEHIEVADALIFPADEKVDVESGGKITKLENAKIVANQKNKYHVINRATVTITGKKAYEASGFYEYNIGDKKQEFELANIIGTPSGKGKRSEKISVTRATGEVQENDHFYIDLKTEFRGKISLSAEEQNLQFDGFAKLDAPKMIGRQWFSVSSKGDKKDLTLQFDEPKNFDGQPLFTGVFLSNEMDAKLYPRLLMPLGFRKDRAVFKAKGLLRFEEEADEFRFGDSLRIVSKVKYGNLMSFSNTDGKIIAEGKFDFCSALSHFEIAAAGRMVTSLKEDPAIKESFDIMTGLDFYLPDALMEIMLADIKSSSFDASNVNFRHDQIYESALAELIPDSKLLHKTISDLKTG
ncbi:MAG: hypothetical protein AB8G15_10150, partial [Saprospiraceae bacterium]